MFIFSETPYFYIVLVCSSLLPIARQLDPSSNHADTSFSKNKRCGQKLALQLVFVILNFIPIHPDTHQPTPTAALHSSHLKLYLLIAFHSLLGIFRRPLTLVWASRYKNTVFCVVRASGGFLGVLYHLDNSWVCGW